MISPAPIPPREQPGVALARGVCRFLLESGFAPLTEFAPVRGLRVDVAALGPRGEIWVVECKSCLADFRSDAKWPGYLDWCDAFFFAAPASFPNEVLPEGEGLIIGDEYDAEIVRPPAPRTLAPARRKALTRKFARVSAQRLRGLIDPGVAAMIEPES